MSTYIEEQFESVLQATGLDKVPKTDVQIVERKRAFYAGATAMFHELTNLIPSIGTPPEHVMNRISELSLEIEEYVGKLGTDE